MSTTRYPVDSTTRRCCGGIGRHSRTCPTRQVTDHPAVVHTVGSAIVVDQLDGAPLNSDQARELASALLVAAAEVDGRQR